MPILKGKGCKSKPDQVIKYITRPDKAEIISSLNMDDSRSYAKQFKDTATIFEKNNKYDERKYYHFIQSFDPKDNITSKEAHRLSEQLIMQCFPDSESVIATHTDKNHIHTHIVINAVSFVNGKKIHLNNNDYAALKDLSNELALQNGYTAVNWRKSSEKKISSSELRIELNGGTSWKEEIREVLDIALVKANTYESFVSIINSYGVEVARGTEKTISFKHPKKDKPIRGVRLGDRYTKEAIMNEFNKRAGAIGKGTINRDKQAEQNGIREFTSETEFNGIHRAIQDVEGRATRGNYKNKTIQSTEQSTEYGEIRVASKKSRGIRI